MIFQQIKEHIVALRKFAHKILHQTIVPAVATAVGGHWRGWLFERVPRPKRKISMLLVAAILALSGLGTVCNLWVGYRAGGHVFSGLDRVPNRYVAVVLGAKVYPSGTPSMVLEDRLATALELYREGKVQKILVSGDHAAPEYDEVNSMYRWLSQRGVPDRDVFLDHAGLRTFDTMKRAVSVFAVRDAIICTQAFHLPRSVFLARHMGIDAVGLVADKRPYRHHWSNHVREFAARTVAVLDTYVLNRRARFGGQVISVYGDGRLTHD